MKIGGQSQLVRHVHRHPELAVHVDEKDDDVHVSGHDGVVQRRVAVAVLLLQVDVATHLLQQRLHLQAQRRDCPLSMSVRSFARLGA